MKHLSARIALYAALTALVVLAGMTITIGTTIAGMFNRIEDVERQILLDDYDQLIRNQVETAVSLLEYHAGRAERGVVTGEEARTAAASALRELSYGTDGYFWADTEDGTNVVLLGRDVEGTNRIDSRDVNGTPLIREIIAAGQKPGGGFTDYWFPKSEGGEAYPKRSYSLLFEPFGWVVGTGNYIDRIDAELDVLRMENERRLRRLVAVLIVVSVVATLVFAIVIVVIGRRLTAPLSSVSTSLETIAEGGGDLTAVLNVTSHDEVGRVAAGFDRFLGSLRSIVIDIKESVGVMKGLGTELSASMAETTAATNQIAANIESLARMVDSQGQEVDTTASSVEELTRSI